MMITKFRKTSLEAFIDSGIGLTVAGVLLIMVFACNASADNPFDAPAQNSGIEFGYPDQTVFVTAPGTEGALNNPMIHLGTVILDKAGYQWYVKAYPARRLFENLKNGSTQFSLLVNVPQLEGYCIYSSRPIYKTRLNIYSIGDKPVISRKEDLKGKTVITILGYSYGGLLAYINDPANKITVSDSRSHESAFHMLRANRGDYLLDYEPASNQVLKQHPINDIRSYPIDELDIFIVVSKTLPNAKRMMEKLEDIAFKLDVDTIISDAPN